MPRGDPFQAGADFVPGSGKETEAVMAMLADVADAVIGVDTHRDLHTLQIAHPSGVPIAEHTIGNDDAGYAEAIAWAGDHAPGPRLFFAVEGTRCYGLGLTRALHAAGLPVIEVVRQARDNRRRGKGKTDRIDAGLAVLAALRLRVDRLPTPRADGDREAMPILLTARDERTTTGTRQVNGLRALLLTGGDTDRHLAGGPLGKTRLDTLRRRRARPAATTGDQIRHAEIRHAEIPRLADAIRAADRELTANNRQLTGLVDATAPDLRHRPGIGPVSAAQAIVAYPPPRPLPPRRRVRLPRRHLPHPRQQRTHHPLAPQPRRRPRPQPRRPHHRPHPDDLLPTHPRL